MTKSGPGWRLQKIMTGVALATAVSACQVATSDRPTPTTAQNIPPASAASDALRRYYGRLQNDLLTRGLLRMDGGGPDTYYSASDLARNFEQIAFFDEYARGAGLQKASGQAGSLRRWSAPVRVKVEFGDSVPPSQREQDRASVQSYVSRLARITGHPISMARTGGNFHVMFLGEDDRELAVSRIKQLAPNINETSLKLVRDIPRTIHCMVIAFSAQSNDNEYQTSVALIRAEHPDLMRRSCVHEEVAQGLGLANDSPAARPSIFNDDDEFALLTTHDEMLLKMLYDRRLSIGMSATTARPIVHQMARELTGTSY